MAADVKYEDHRKLLISFALKVQRRMFAAGIKTDPKTLLEDIVGELTVAWTIASQRYQPGIGAFVGYLMLGMRHHINRWVAEQIEQHQLAPFSMDVVATNDHDDNGGENGALMFDAAIQAPGADDLLIEKDARAFANRRLSPLARQFISLLENPPEELVAELKAIQTRSAYARGRGINSAAPQQVGAAIIFGAMGCNRTERASIYNELKAIAEAVSHR